MIVVNYNGRPYIGDCLESIVVNDYPNKEIIIVDNGSNDSSPEIIRSISEKYDQQVNIVSYFLDRNYGPNAGRNIGIQNARGEICLFVDHDTHLSRSLMQQLVEFMYNNENVAAVQPLLFSYQRPDTIDTSGHYLTVLGFVSEPGKNSKMKKNELVANTILGARGVFAIRRQIFDVIGAFDESYFLGWDETELFWRIWVAGYEVVCLSTIWALHVGSSSRQLNPGGLINGYRTFFAILQPSHLIRISAFYTLALGYSVGLAAAKNPTVILQVMNSATRFFSEFGELLTKRRRVQLHIRKLEDDQYLPKVTAKMTISELLTRANGFSTTRKGKSSPTRVCS